MFEFFFKYPRSVYSRGQIALLGAWPKWILVLLIVSLPPLATLAWLIRSASCAGRADGAELARLGHLGAAERDGGRGPHSPLAAGDYRSRAQAATEHHCRADRRFAQHGDQGKRQDARSQEQAVETLQNGVLANLNKSFQTRLYRMDDAPARIDDVKTLAPNATSTRIGDSLKQLVQETADLPIGAVVLLSDGSDNTGGLDTEAINALRARHIPVHTVGFGREHADRDVELDDAVVAPRALAGSRIAAKITLHQRGYAGAKTTLTVRDVSDRHAEDSGFAADHSWRGGQSADRDGSLRYRRRGSENAADRRHASRRERKARPTTR